MLFIAMGETWVKVFRNISEFRILRLTFHWIHDQAPGLMRPDQDLQFAKAIITNVLCKIHNC